MCTVLSSGAFFRERRITSGRLSAPQFADGDAGIRGPGSVAKVRAAFIADPEVHTFRVLGCKHYGIDGLVAKVQV